MGRCVAEARQVMVYFDYAAGEPRPLPDEIRRMLDEPATSPVA
jgi:acyl-CoA thioesterase FadM